MHDARTLAALFGLPAPPLCEWMAAPLSAPGTPIGCFAAGNLLQPDFAFDAELPGPWVFAWSGTLAGGLTEKSPLNWVRGPALLHAACESLGPQLVRHGRRLLLVPHARHVLSDARSTLEWWSRHVIPGQELQADTRAPEGERPFGLALDPMALLEPEMMMDAPDHLRTLFAVLGPRADAVIVRAAVDGEFPVPLLMSLVRAHVPAGTPVLVAANAVGGMVEAVRQGG